MVAESSMSEVWGAVEPAVLAAGLVVESVDVAPAGKRRLVTIVVDLPAEEVGAASLDQVSEATHGVSEALDVADLFGESPYVLEVTTPGIDRPLAGQRHWSRARTRLVEATTTSGTVSGRLTAVDDDGVTIVQSDEQEIVLAWADIERGQMVVDFGDHKAEKKRRKLAAKNKKAAARAAGEGE